MSPLSRPVRVRFYRDGAGFKYVVLAADSLTWIAEGWTRGTKRAAIESFRERASKSGWIDAETRAERMRGAA
jgi:hypothetical protein